MCQEEIKEIKKVNQSRKHKITNSLGVYDAYKWIRKNKWLDIGQPIKEHQFYTIIRLINKFIKEQLLECKSINLPHRMGKLELRKKQSKIEIVDGKLKIKMPVDWNKTLKLWVEDKESKKNKVLIRHESKEIYRVFYNKNNAIYKNKSYFKFHLNREFKKDLKEKILDNKIDAYIL